MKKITSMLVFLGIIASLYSQELQITGKVTNAKDNTPLPGVSVIIQGTTIGTTTTIDGEYTITAAANATLEFRSLGMESQALPINGKTTIDIKLEESATDLEEVMVVAYGKQTKDSYTGAGVSIKSEDLQKRPVANLVQAIEAKAAGVQVKGINGQPGQGAAIRIRGSGSLNASNNPLYIVDGVAYSGPLNGINMSDVENITVHKDAASNALYGSRAANGVVLITTKSGKSGKTEVEFDAKIGFNGRGVPEYDRITDPGQYYELMWLALKNKYIADGISDAVSSQAATDSLILGGGGFGGLQYNAFDVPNDELVIDGKLNPNAKLLYHDDWFDALHKPDIRQEYQLSLSSGDEKSKYYLSLGWLDDRGYLLKSNFDRISVRANAERKFTKWLRGGLNSSFSSTNQDYPNLGNVGSDNNTILYITRKIAPIYPVYQRDADGNYILDGKGKNKYDWGVRNEDPLGRSRPFHAPGNIVATMIENIYKNHYNNLTLNGFAEVSILQDLKFIARSSLSISDRDSKQYWTPSGGDAKVANGRLYVYQSNAQSETHNQVLVYTKGLGKHKLDAKLGHEIYKYAYNYTYNHKTNLVLPGNTELINFQKMENTVGYKAEHHLESYFSNFAYSFDEQYYMSASYRLDGSSKFHKDNRWGNFWSLGGAVILNRYAIFAGQDWLNRLKVKASYGNTGNDNIDSYYPYQKLYTFITAGGVQPTQLPNDDFSWEKNQVLNAGVEFAALSNRLFVDVDVFAKKTLDMLYFRKRPISSGTTSITENIADMRNVGVEFAVNGDLIKTRSGLTVNVFFNGTHIKNEILKLPPEIEVEGGQVNGTKKWVTGGSRYDFYLREYAGVGANGEALYYKDEIGNDGKKTGNRVTTDRTSEADRYILGTANPDLYGGFGSNLYFRGIDFSFLFSYQLGGLIYDASYQGLNDFRTNQLGVTYSADVLNAWSPTNTSSNIPQVEFGNREIGAASSRWLTNASFLYLRNITLGYTLPQEWVGKLKVGYTRIYATVDNAYLFSKRKGLDPSQSFSGNASNDIAALRAVVFGCNLKF